MALYKHLRAFWQSDAATEVLRQRMIQWREEPATVRTERPERLDRARSVGYKAKHGYCIVRQRVLRGGRQRPKITGGRRSKHARRRKILRKNYQRVAEERAQRGYPNLTVLNSYLLAKDGRYAWYEIILVDPGHPNIQRERNLNGLAQQRGRVERGLTQAGRRSRGLRNKGKGTEKNRPSLNAHAGRGN